MLRPTFLILLFVICSTSLAADEVETDTANCPIKGGDGPFSYDPTSGKGPADWASLLPEYEACGNGKSQSPINFVSDVDYLPLSKGPQPMLKDGNFTFDPTSSNWALSCPLKECGSTMFKGEVFYHFNTHFHSPSEHTLNGKSFPLEAHFVHASEDGKLAVLATLFDYPSETGYVSTIVKGANKELGVNAYFKEILKGVSEGKNKVLVQTNEVIDAAKGYCSYSGSLTTPPCSEDVTWMMSLNIETVSRRQVHAYFVSAGASFDGNNRPIQPLNGRNITCYV